MISGKVPRLCEICKDEVEKEINSQRIEFLDSLKNEFIIQLIERVEKLIQKL